MAGAVVATGVIGCTAVIALGLVAVGGAQAASRHAATVADAAALAAADTVSGLVVGGEPCTRASEVARDSGSRLTECRLDGLTATVRVEVSYGTLDAAARARAGPPPQP